MLKKSSGKLSEHRKEKAPRTHLLLKVALGHVVLLYLFWSVGQWAVGR